MSPPCRARAAHGLQELVDSNGGSDKDSTPDSANKDRDATILSRSAQRMQLRRSFASWTPETKNPRTRDLWGWTCWRSSCACVLRGGRGMTSREGA